MRLTPAGLEDYLLRVARLIERYGITLDVSAQADLRLETSTRGAFSFALRGYFPGGPAARRSALEIREVWRRTADDEVERWEYEYDLIDQERGFRRGFHLHDREDFIRRYNVVVHEHCEQPMGMASCPHHAGQPVRDAYRGMELLMDIWADPSVPDCEELACLDPVARSMSRR